MKKNNFSQNPFVRASHLSTELGEVVKALIILQRIKPSPKKSGKFNAHEDAKRELGEEIFDLIWNALAVAEVSGVDVEAAIRSKMEKNKDRKFFPS